MLFCEDCGALFSEALLSREFYGECHGYPVYANAYICPVCGGAPQELPQKEDAYSITE